MSKTLLIGLSDGMIGADTVAQMRDLVPDMDIVRTQDRPEIEAIEYSTSFCLSKACRAAATVPGCSLVTFSTVRWIVRYSFTVGSVRTSR